MNCVVVLQLLSHAHLGIILVLDGFIVYPANMVLDVKKDQLLIAHLKVNSP